MYETLMEEVVGPENYGKALKAVIANGGAPGIDGMKTEELNGHLLQHWPEDPCQADGGNLCAEPREAGGNPEAERRETDAGNHDGAGSVHPTDVATSDDADLGT